MNNNKTARVAGLLYLVVIIFGVFSELYVRSTLVVQGDALATAHNIMASEWLFRLGFVSDLIMMTCYFFLVMVLYKLLKSVNKNAALIMVLCVVISVAILCINMLNHFAAMLLLSGDDYLKVFEEDQLHAMAMFFLKMHGYGYVIAQIFFGLWLFPLGYLVFRSDYFPRILGILLMIATIGMLIEFCNVFLFPSYDSIILELFYYETAIAEFGFCLWLLIKGVKDSSQLYGKADDGRN